MNQFWSEQNKKMQSLLKKATFSQGIDALLSLRETLMEEIHSWQDKLSPEDYAAMPFPGVNGYHSKTVAYSIWHVMRIEDIVVNTLIRSRPEIFFAEGFREKTASPFITTGNELQGEEIVEFSRSLNIPALFQYAEAVWCSTDRWLRSIGYESLKQRFSTEDADRIRQLQVVSNSERAIWLIDYWCGKDVAGLLKMPLSRHWIMHIEAAQRIIKKLGT